MIVILKNNLDSNIIQDFILQIEQKKGIKTHLSQGENTTIVGLVGDTSGIDINAIRALPIVEDVRRVSEPFKKANRKFHVQDSIIEIGDKKIGGKNFMIFAGPCSVESEEGMDIIAKGVYESGANGIRGGAFKPRTSPYSFQGLENEGLNILKKSAKKYNLPIVSEIMDLSDLEYFEGVDVIQVGARNMQNFRMLRALGEQKTPILLKRGLANTIEELLMSAEYIMAGGNPNVILCERGIRTFETYTRNTLDISAVPVIKRLSHLPVVVDPSHAGGEAYLVPALSKAAVAAGANGLLIEVHDCPGKALSDGAQSLTPGQFDLLMHELKKYIEAEGKVIS